jgi:PiT family inorganic phosphate transporter
MVLIFIIGVMLYTAVRVDATNGGSLFIVIAAMIGGYMAMNIGANDVANNVGPLAAIVEVVGSGAGEITAAAPIPLWVMVVGALGIAIGLGLFGPKVIRTVGSEITELDQMRAYCIAMAATLTVILASQLGLPVSTTHVAVGAVFGVGFLREYLAPMLFLTIKGMLRG